MQKYLFFEILQLFRLTKNYKNASVTSKMQMLTEIIVLFVLILYTGLITHEALDSTVETQGVGQRPKAGPPGGGYAH